MQFEKDPLYQPVKLRRDVKHLIETIYINLRRPYASSWVSQVSILAPQARTSRLCKASKFWSLNELSGVVDSVRARILRRVVAFCRQPEAPISAKYSFRNKVNREKSRHHPQQLALQSMAFAATEDYRSAARTLDLCTKSKIALLDRVKHLHDVEAAPRCKHTDAHGCYSKAALAIIAMLGQLGR